MAAFEEYVALISGQRDSVGSDSVVMQLSCFGDDGDELRW